MNVRRRPCRSGAVPAEDLDDWMRERCGQFDPIWYFVGYSATHQDEITHRERRSAPEHLRIMPVPTKASV